MSVFSVTDASQTFLLSETAAEKVRSLIAAEDTTDALSLRVAVRPGGCSGYSYEMFFDADIADDDIRSQHGDVQVVIDPASFQLLKGATLDFKDGLQGAGFAINNPNAERSCGCGQSFS
jgi:iron-sulfur cluster assembly protein/iron-sulfur cluster insertion protein